MLVVKNDVKNEKYYSLILYAKLRCDMFTLALPDFYTKTDSRIRSREFIEYKEQAFWRLEDLKPHILKEYSGAEYCGSVREYFSYIYVMELNDDSQGHIMATDSLFSWKYADMPEDLCFFSKGKCWMKSIAHEEICWIYTDNDVEKDIIKKVLGLRYIEVQHDERDVPVIPF